MNESKINHESIQKQMFNRLKDVEFIKNAALASMQKRTAIIEQALNKSIDEILIEVRYGRMSNTKAKELIYKHFDIRNKRNR